MRTTATKGEQRKLREVRERKDFHRKGTSERDRKGKGIHSQANCGNGQEGNGLGPEVLVRTST